MNYNKELKVIVKAMKKAYKRFGVHRAAEIKDKAAFDLVTDIDTSVEKYLKNILM